MLEWAVEPKIIYENGSFFIIDKPSGWIVNDSKTVKFQPVIQTWLEKFKYPLSGSRELRSGIVHRLDKETSGLLIVAKTKDVFEKLQIEFKNREVEKKYIALCHGRFEQNEGQIKVAVGRLPWRRDRFGVLSGGREAETEYKVLSVFNSRQSDYGGRFLNLKFKIQNQRVGFSLVEFLPKTGRTHQIRIHAKYINHPIVADEFYAGRKTARSDRKWCPRLFLHACAIKFIHPETGKAVEYNSELPGDLKCALDKVNDFKSS